MAQDITNVIKEFSDLIPSIVDLTASVEDVSSVVRKTYADLSAAGVSNTDLVVINGCETTFKQYVQDVHERKEAHKASLPPRDFLALKEAAMSELVERVEKLEEAHDDLLIVGKGTSSDECKAVVLEYVAAHKAVRNGVTRLKHLGTQQHEWIDERTMAGVLKQCPSFLN